MSTLTKFRNDREMFTRGGCYILAQVIHDRTGWDIYGLDDGWDELPGIHVFVMTPMGLCLDIEGISTPEELAARWGFYEVRIFPDGYYFDDNEWGETLDVDEVTHRAEKIADDLIVKAARFRLGRNNG